MLWPELNNKCLQRFGKEDHRRSPPSVACRTAYIIGLNAPKLLWTKQKQLKINWTELIGDFIVFSVFMAFRSKFDESKLAEILRRNSISKFMNFFSIRLTFEVWFRMLSLETEQDVYRRIVLDISALISIFVKHLKSLWFDWKFILRLKSARFATINVVYLLN